MSSYIDGFNETQGDFDYIVVENLTPNAITLANSAKQLVSMSALTDGQIPIGRSNNTPIGGSISGSANVIVANGSGAISLDTIQNIQTTSDVQFHSANLSGLTINQPVHTDAKNNLVSGLISLTSDVSGVLPVANGGTNSSAAFSFLPA